MSPEAQRIAIAEACGWERSDDEPNILTWRHRDEIDHTCLLPDYLNDLNAMHEAEKVLNFEKDERGMYLVYLAKLTDCQPSFATAAQRAEAFLKALGKWKEEPITA